MDVGGRTDEHAVLTMSDLGQRFWAKVDKDGPVHPVLGTPCWLWTPPLNVYGYGHFWADGKIRRSHVVAYELTNGPVPDGLGLDHLCHTHDEECPGGRTCLHRSCVNPEHLEAVTHAENLRRGKIGQASGAQQRAKTHCPKGHPYDDGKNLYVTPRGERQCRTCKRDAMRSARASS